MPARRARCDLDLTLGRPLLPIGTVYDPFVARALEPWSSGRTPAASSILVGTPSGVTLAPEGGAHQSVTTPSIGLETPGVTAYEPAFAVETEWCLLDALSRLGRPDGESAYLRLSTRPLDQALADLPADPAALEPRRRDVLAGGYRLRSAAAPRRDRGGRRRDGAGGAGRRGPARRARHRRRRVRGDLLRPAVAGRAGPPRAAAGPQHGVDETVLDRLLRPAPLVTVLDGHPHTLAFLGTVHGSPTTCLGVTEAGQGGNVGDVHAAHGLDARSVVEAVLDLVD